MGCFHEPEVPQSPLYLDERKHRSHQPWESNCAIISYFITEKTESQEGEGTCPNLTNERLQNQLSNPELMGQCTFSWALPRSEQLQTAGTPGLTFWLCSWAPRNPRGHHSHGLFCDRCPRRLGRAQPGQLCAVAQAEVLGWPKCLLTFLP